MEFSAPSINFSGLFATFVHRFQSYVSEIEKQASVLVGEV
jgi:hypothetical protein